MGRYLFLEVPNGVLVGVGEEVQDLVLDVVLLEVVHQVGSVALREALSRLKTHRPTNS